MMQSIIKMDFPSEIHLIIVFYFAHKTNRGWVTKRPDIDNLVKTVLDGLMMCGLKDDSSIVYISAGKKYAECDHAIITIQEAL